MPRRSSSQEHRLVELFKDAEQANPAPSPAVIEPAKDQTTYLNSPEEEKPFDHAKWQLEIKATRMALPSGSRKTKQGKRVAENIFHHLQQGDGLKAHILSSRERDKQPAPIPARSQFREKMIQRAMVGPAG